MSEKEKADIIWSNFGKLVKGIGETETYAKKWAKFAAKGSIQTQKARNLQNRNFKIGY
jgi:hypothetical protein